MSPMAQIARRDRRLKHDRTRRNGQICSDDRETGPTGLARSVIRQPPLSWAVILRVRRSLPVFPDKQTL
jgi:hypothetical protein